MIGERTKPLLFVLFLAGALLVTRLYQVQVVEHDVWAREAARLVHTGAVLPYERGAIRDRHGRVLTRDKKTYTLALYYRDFRRGNVLGQVAHARSLLEQRAVPLSVDGLWDWARALVRLTPAELDAFGKGASLELLDLKIPADPEPKRSHRRGRAADAGYYIRQLLGLNEREWKALQKRVKRGEVTGSYLDLAVRVRIERGEPTDPVLFERDLAVRVESGVEHLRRLAALLDLEAPPESGAVDVFEALVYELETARRWVEDATASKLFVEAAGFAPGRFRPDVLLRFVELDWIRMLLAWDVARFEEWAQRSRSGWRTSWLAQYAIPRLVAGLRADGTDPPGPDDLLDGLAAVFGPRGSMERALDGNAVPWRRANELAALDGLAELFDLDEGPKREPVLPFEEEEARTFQPKLPWNLIDRMRVPLPATPTLGPELERLFVFGGRSRERSPEDLFAELLDAWEELYHDAVLVELDRLQAAAKAEGELSPGGRLVLAGGLRERAVERADYYLKDFGMRPRFLLRGEPDYRVIWLPTRYPDRYAGFEAREARQRVVEILPGDDAPLASELIGAVSSFDVNKIQRQRRARQKLATLKNLPDRDAAEEVELRELVGSVVLHDQKRGVSGVEGFWNEELTGTNGYRESWGLSDAMDGEIDRVPVREAVDGDDLWLTLDTELQRAAERTLRGPLSDGNPIWADALRDEEWLDAPVGGIVLLTPEGDVLAAASEPGLGSLVSDETVGQRGLLLERTLRRPTFQPPGSVFKPFVAAHALQTIGLDPTWRVNCAPLAGGRAGYVDVRCHKRLGHGEVDLESAIIQSCNAYFAALGERLRQRDFRRLGGIFGFGEETGLRIAPPGSPATRRFGLVEEPGWRGLETRWKPIEHRLAGNGLGVVEATPMQVARATAGLALGRLPDLRLVWRIGERDLEPPATRRIDIAPDHLERVRVAMGKVASEPNGTAYKALGPHTLGYDVAVKTGSADITGRRDDERDYRARKHTWVAGWLPPEDPEIVFVVFIHNTITTSSHGAVYVARELFDQPEMQAWLADRGFLQGEGR